MTPKHEYTSWKVSRIASKVMRMAARAKKGTLPISLEDEVVWKNKAGELTLAEVEALAGSCMTQSRDRLKKKAK